MAAHQPRGHHETDSIRSRSASTTSTASNRERLLEPLVGATGAARVWQVTTVEQPGERPYREGTVAEREQEHAVIGIIAKLGQLAVQLAHVLLERVSGAVRADNNVLAHLRPSSRAPG
jgi:hypothetical protein